MAAAFVAWAGLAEGGYRLLLRRRAALAAPAAGAFELYAIGESTAFGQPFFEGLAFPRLVGRLFGDSIGGRPVVLRNLARGGETIYPQTLALRRAASGRDRRNPGVVLIYCGHNENFDDAQGYSRAERALKFFKERVVYPSWLASDAFESAERALGYRGLRDLHSYELYLRRAVETSRDAGLTPILSTVVGNLQGVEPNASSADEPAMAFYRRAQALEAAKDFAGARDFYWRAVDADPRTAFGRTTRAQNDLIKALSREYGVPLVDAVPLFEARSPHGLIGSSLFVDGQHPNMTGTLLLASGFAAAVAAASGEPATIRLDERAAFEQAGFGREQQAESYIKGGIWLLEVSRGHPAPVRRLALARLDFQKAAALAPSDFWAALALKLTDAQSVDAGSAERLAWIRRLYYEPHSQEPDGDLKARIADALKSQEPGTRRRLQGRRRP